ncbi:hypothetical protein [Microbacterium hibisci]|uniref:hypothetical protein n=1 Tax=Microbacterium hibisci TaxID=2036000 RepID=UPI001941B789|nr:hypothetical protein [Microbacterium hibisci]
MSDTDSSSDRRNGWMRWLGLGAVALLAVVVVVWALLATRPAAESSAPVPTVSETPTTSPTPTTPTPQPTEFETPEPGATEPVTKPEEAPEIPLDARATAGDDVVVEVTSIEAVTAGRDLPGEQSGAALAVSVRITNNGDEAVDTSGSNVNLTFGGDERVPGAALTGDETADWPASIPPGENATAVYLFSRSGVPSGEIRVIVDLLATEPDVVFVGPEP